MTWSFPMDEDGGFIVIDKPKGPTSHQIDYWVREITGIAKVGHVGTLDPQATGVLAMALGKATRLIDIAHEQPKEYVGIMKLHGDVERTRLEEVLREFIGEVIQLPPMRSAVARRLRTRKIYELELLEIKERDVLFRVKCESGTYIRTLCVDIGYVLGTGANMTELRRTKTGVFFEDQTVTLQDLSDAVELSRTGKPNLLKAMFHDPTFLFKEKAKIVVKDSTIHNISKGSDLYPGGIRKIIGEPMKGDRVMVSSESGKFLGTGIMLANFMDITDLKVVDFDRIMVDPVEGNVNKIEEKPKVNSADKLHIHTFDKTMNIPKIRGNESEVKLRTDRPSDYRKNIEAAPGKKSFVRGKENSFRDKGKERRPGSEERANRFGRDRTSESFRPQFKRREERLIEKNNFVPKDKGKGEQKNYRFSGERKENFTGKEKENVRTFPSEPFPGRTQEQEKDPRFDRNKGFDKKKSGQRNDRPPWQRDREGGRVKQESFNKGNYNRGKGRRTYDQRETSQGSGSSRSGYGNRDRRPSYRSGDEKDRQYRDKANKSGPPGSYGSKGPGRKGKKNESR